MKGRKAKNMYLFVHLFKIVDNHIEICKHIEIKKKKKFFSKQNLFLISIIYAYYLVLHFRPNTCILLFLLKAY